MSRRAYAAILLADLQPTQRLVLMYFAACADYADGTGSRPSKERCARDLHLGVRTVGRACRELEEGGFLVVENDTPGSSWEYRIQLQRLLNHTENAVENPVDNYISPPVRMTGYPRHDDGGTPVKLTGNPLERILTDSLSLSSLGIKPLGKTADGQRSAQPNRGRKLPRDWRPPEAVLRHLMIERGTDDRHAEQHAQAVQEFRVSNLTAEVWDRDWDRRFARFVARRFGLDAGPILSLLADGV